MPVSSARFPAGRGGRGWRWSVHPVRSRTLDTKVTAFLQKASLPQTKRVCSSLERNDYRNGHNVPQLTRKQNLFLCIHGKTPVRVSCRSKPGNSKSHYRHAHS